MGKGFERELKAILERHGCKYERPAKGSHELWSSPLVPYRFTIPDKVVSRHTANAILKQAGIQQKL